MEQINSVDLTSSASAVYDYELLFDAVSTKPREKSLGGAIVPYELSIQEKEGYLHFQVTGENEIETVKNYLQAIHQECVNRGCSSILVEENLSGPGLRMLDIFRIAEQGSQLATSKIRRVAYVDRNFEHSYDNMKFAATVASNRGLNVRLFSSVTEAEKWLVLSIRSQNGIPDGTTASGLTNLQNS